MMITKSERLEEFERVLEDGAWMEMEDRDGVEGKSKRNAVTREARSLYSAGTGPVDPEGCKGGGISIPSQICMICMIKRGSTRLKVGGAVSRGAGITVNYA